MREGNPVANQAAPGRPARRLRLATPATALVLGCLTLALVAAEWPFAGLAHLGVNSSNQGPQWWTFTPFGVVGFVVAWRKPRNPLGWCLLGLAVAGAQRGWQLLRDRRLLGPPRHAAPGVGGHARPARLGRRDRPDRADRPDLPRRHAAVRTAAVGDAAALLFNAASFLVSAACLVLIRTSSPAQ
jgi:hypothetical protein